MYIRSNLTTGIPDMTQHYASEIDKTNIDLIYYFILLHIRMLVLQRKKRR